MFKNILSKKTFNTPYLVKAPKEEDFNFDLIEHYFKHKVQLDNFQIINDRIMNDIDFHELFRWIDRTHSKVGQQYFYNQLLTINNNLNFDDQENLIKYFISKEAHRLKAQSLLSKLNKRNSYYISNLFLDGYIPKPKWFWVTGILSFTGFAALILTFFYNQVFVLLLFIYIINIAVHFWNKNNIIVYMDSIPQLPLLCCIAKIFTSMDFLHDSKKPVLSAVASLNELKYVIKFFKSDTSIKSDIYLVILFFWEMIKVVLLIEPLVVFYVLKKLEVKKNNIQVLFEYIGKIDSALAVKAIRMEASCFCKPEFTKTHHSFGFIDIYHPLIPDCVPNSLQTNGKSILLTGSNMSGKTTFIRTVAINILLAQTINTCFAKTFQLPQTRLFSAIRISDDLLNDKSYYFEEVLTVKNMIAESSLPFNNVFLLDEIFKGTNTIERIAAGKAVLSCLAKSNNNIVFVSTHDIELMDLLSDEYNFYHFTETVHEKQIHFDYQLKTGKLYTKNAIRILEINDYPEEVITEARAITQMMQKADKCFAFQYVNFVEKYD